MTTWRTDPSPTSLGESITRFRDPASAHLPLRPFPAYERQPASQGPAPRTGKFAPRAKPKFGLQAGWHVITVDIEPGTSLYGTGEQAGPLLRNGITKTLWNTDAFDYNDKSPSIYQSHPWVLAVRKDGSAFGVIFETTARLVINLKQGITAMLKTRRGIPAGAGEHDRSHAAAATVGDWVPSVPLELRARCASARDCQGLPRS
jgi:hypothetical protein